MGGGEDGDVKAKGDVFCGADLKVSTEVDEGNAAGEEPIRGKTGDLSGIKYAEEMGVKEGEGIYHWIIIHG